MRVIRDGLQLIIQDDREETIARAHVGAETYGPLLGDDHDSYMRASTALAKWLKVAIEEQINRGNEPPRPEDFK